jgi:hypothetical protein
MISESLKIINKLGLEKWENYMLTFAYQDLAFWRLLGNINFCEEQVSL